MSVSEKGDFAGEFTRRFSQGPEKDISVEIAYATDSGLDALPAGILDYLDTLDPFTKKRIYEQLEELISSSVKSGVEIGEDSESYRRQYDEWGWQYDETPLVASPAALSVIRDRKLAQLSQNLHLLMRSKAEENET